MASRSLSLNKSGGPVRDKVADAILSLIVAVPQTSEASQGAPLAARDRAQAITRAASRKASLLAGSMALPPGLLGWLTLLPEIISVWRLQSQMVADIAGVYGKSATLSREQMLYCLFRHISAQVLRDVVVQAGERFLVQKASGAVLKNLAQKLGVKVTQQVMGKGASRLIPLLGALGVGAYAYFDTGQVAKTAMDLFSKDLVFEDSNEKGV